MERIGKEFYYLKVAQAVSERSTCLRRKFGAVIVKDDRIVSTGYNGAPRGRINCCDRGICYRKEHNIAHGTQYERCRSAHGEWNAIISASRDEMNDATMYIFGTEADTGELVKDIDCCAICRRMIINAGITLVVFADNEHGIGSDHVPFKAKIVRVQDWIDHDDSLDEGLTAYGETPEESAITNETSEYRKLSSRLNSIMYSDASGTLTEPVETSLRKLRNAAEFAYHSGGITQSEYRLLEQALRKYRA